MSLVPVPAEQGGATCAGCGAPLVADQRYCLSCGQPASPVRLAFLDALHGDGAATGVATPAIAMGAAGYAPQGDSGGANGWLRRNSGLLSLLAVLILCLIVGLLVGHWAGQGGTKVPAKQVVEVKGLTAAPAAAAAATTPATTTPVEAKESAKAKAAAAKAEAKETKVEKAPPSKPVKVAPAKIKKLTNSSGKQHQEEINSLGAQPIETG
jgi:hypothetical protein